MRRPGPTPSVSEGRCAELVGLISEGPGMTSAEIREHFHISEGSWKQLLRYARDRYLPRFGLAIPRPTMEDGYRFHITGAWKYDDPDDPAIKDGHRVQITDSDTRIRSSIRDLRVAYANQPDKRAAQAREIKSRLDVLVGIKAHAELLIELNQRDLDELAAS